MKLVRRYVTLLVILSCGVVMVIWMRSLNADWGLIWVQKIRLKTKQKND